MTTGRNDDALRSIREENIGIEEPKFIRRSSKEESTQSFFSTTEEPKFIRRSSKEESTQSFFSTFVLASTGSSKDVYEAKHLSELNFEVPKLNDKDYRAFARYSTIKASKTVQENLDKVIFPSTNWIKKWDSLMIILLFFNLIMMPYEAGVSYFYLFEMKSWLIINESITFLFMIDIFFYFRRPYRGKDRKWVIDLKLIRNHYLKTMFIFDFLSVMPVSLFLIYNYNINYLTVICKLLRFARFTRIPRLLSSSEALVNFRMKIKSDWLNIFKFFSFIMLSAHLLACIWCSIPYLENQCDIDKVRDENNWISNWYNDYIDNSDYIFSGRKTLPNPFGKENHFNRYIISLFWAMQTITSIGYGNIVPVTFLEWSVSCFLQMCACIGWAYSLGGLIDTVIGLNEDEEEFGGISDEVNTLIRIMNDQGEGYEAYGCEGDQWEKIILVKKLIVKRIRSCLYDKYKLSSLPFVSNNNVGLCGSYPILSSLPLNLREHASILLIQKYLNCIPYLSSRFFTLSEQAALCLQCTLSEYPGGEVVNTEGMGNSNCQRGIWLILNGCACYARDRSCNSSRCILSSGTMVGAGRALLEDCHPFIGGRIFFLTYSRVLFIPKSAIQKTLFNNENGKRAWKMCGRWVYARTVLSKDDITQAY